MSRTLDSVKEGNWEQKLCRGNLISRVNYTVDINHWGFQDGRRWDEAERDQPQQMPAAANGG